MKENNTTHSTDDAAIISMEIHTSMNGTCTINSTELVLYSMETFVVLKCVYWSSQVPHAPSVSHNFFLNACTDDTST